MTIGRGGAGPKWSLRAMQWAGRAFAGLTPQAVAVVLAILTAFSLSRNFGDFFVSIRDGVFVSGWLSELGKDVFGHVAVAATMIVIVMPVMNLGPRFGPRRVVALAFAVGAAAGCGAVIRMTYLDVIGIALPWATMFTKFFVPLTVRYGLMAAMLTLVTEFHRREVRSVDAMLQAELDRARLDREMAEARLQVLQAQIEPHFLFNTLANVRRLYQTDFESGRNMLDSLMRYLEVALPRMRDSSSTLEREASLIEAYLNVHKVRMGRRLDFELDFPATLRAHTVPPMMLLTLVENAIKHGLNALPEGGTIRVSAGQEAGTLRLRVTDTGRGFGGDSSGGGTGLANIQARLSAMYGSTARLELSTNAPRGITALLVLPMIAAQAEAA